MAGKRGRPAKRAGKKAKVVEEENQDRVLLVKTLLLKATNNQVTRINWGTAAAPFTQVIPQVLCQLLTEEQDLMITIVTRNAFEHEFLEEKIRKMLPKTKLCPRKSRPYDDTIVTVAGNVVKFLCRNLVDRMEDPLETDVLLVDTGIELKVSGWRTLLDPQIPKRIVLFNVTETYPFPAPLDKYVHNELLLV